MNIWRDRLVLPDCTVIMPEDVSGIRHLDMHGNEVVDFNKTGDDRFWHADISAARLDRCTGLTDKNGRMIYERDYVYYCGNILRIYVVGRDKYGAWVLRSIEGNTVYLDSWIIDVEVMGHVPYSEETDHE